MKKYLIIYKEDKTNIAIDNVGVFEGKTKEEAKQRACAKWYTSAYKGYFLIEELDKLEDGFSFYELM